MGVCIEEFTLEQAFEVKLVFFFGFINVLTAVQLWTSNESLLHGILNQIVLYFGHFVSIELAIGFVFYLDTAYVVLADRILRQVSDKFCGNSEYVSDTEWLLNK